MLFHLPLPVLPLETRRLIAVVLVTTSFMILHVLPYTALRIIELIEKKEKEKSKKFIAS